MNSFVPAIAVCLLGSLAGCAHTHAAVTAASHAPVDTNSAIDVSDDIRKLCKIEDTERTPKFDFDSSDLDHADRATLIQVARCLMTGPLRGRGIELVGRADPRGETEYNLTLGSSRSARVDAYLAKLGVDPVQLTPTSRGELDATGTDEESWRRDRRVDLRLRKPETLSLLGQ